jgi:tRNA pseudouridine32 synthase/23S rRNA pseudouridine746 synthase
MSQKHPSIKSHIIEHHITIKSDKDTAVDLLAMESGLSKQKIKQAMLKGSVWLTRGNRTNRLRRARKQLKAGETLHLYYDTHVLDSKPEDAKLMSDEGAYSVWYKPYGMLSQGSKWGDHCAINRWVEKNLAPQRPCFIVHRLDRAATGLILIAHKKQTAANLSRLFQKRQVRKQYRVIVHGHFPDNKKTLTQTLDGRSAISHVRLLEYDIEQQQSLLEVEIETGRKHQIRRHLAELGLPVVGDRLYGDTSASDKNLQLTACYLAFKCPVSHTQKEFRLEAEYLPKLSPN